MEIHTLHCEHGRPIDCGCAPCDKGYLGMRYRGWVSPKHFRLRYWLFHIWNDYDLWNWRGRHDVEIQGVRILGFEWN